MSIRDSLGSVRRTREAKAVQPKATESKSAAAPKPAAKAAGAAANGPQKRTIIYEAVQMGCGHVQPLGVVVGEPASVTEAHREAFRKRRCPGCVGARQQKRRQTPPERLPHGSCFLVEYDAPNTVWSGTLSVPLGDGQTLEFSDRAGAVFKLLRILDAAYRQSLKADQEEAAG